MLPAGQHPTLHCCRPSYSKHLAKLRLTRVRMRCALLVTPYAESSQAENDVSLFVSFYSELHGCPSVSTTHKHHRLPWLACLPACLGRQVRLDGDAPGHGWYEKLDRLKLSAESSSPPTSLIDIRHSRLCGGSMYISFRFSCEPFPFPGHNPLRRGKRRLPSHL